MIVTTFVLTRKTNLLSGIAGLDHVSVSELLTLGTLAADLAGHRHLSTLGTGLHDEAQDTVACSADGKTAQKLVLKGLGLGLGVQATGSNALDEKLDSARLQVKSDKIQKTMSKLNTQSCKYKKEKNTTNERTKKQTRIYLFWTREVNSLMR